MLDCFSTVLMSFMAMSICVYVCLCHPIGEHTCGNLSSFVLFLVLYLPLSTNSKTHMSGVFKDTQRTHKVPMFFIAMCMYACVYVCMYACVNTFDLKPHFKWFCSLTLFVVGNVGWFLYIAKLRGAKVQLLKVGKILNLKEFFSSNMRLHLYSLSKYRKGKCCSIFWGARRVHPDRCDCTLSLFPKVALLLDRDCFPNLTLDRYAF